MRTPRRIRQKMYYSLRKSTSETYEKDGQGNIIYDIIGGTYVPRTTGEQIETYEIPVEFFNSISGELTEDEMRAFGGEKIGNAKMTYQKGEFPFVTGTLIWKNTEPVVSKEGVVDGDSADYIVLGVLDAGKNFWKCILMENVKNETS